MFVQEGVTVAGYRSQTGNGKQLLLHSLSIQATVVLISHWWSGDALALRPTARKPPDHKNKIARLKSLSFRKLNIYINALQLRCVNDCLLGQSVFLSF